MNTAVHVMDGIGHGHIDDQHPTLRTVAFAPIHTGPEPELDPEIEIAGATPAVEPGVARSWSGRVLAIALLAATAFGLVWGSAQVYGVLTDAWIAPLHLSPDSDKVAQLRLQHQHTLAELSRVDAEITRLDGELEAIDAAVAKLSQLRGSAHDTLVWQAEQSRVETRGLRDASKLLARQRALLDELSVRQAKLVTRGREDLAAGLIDRSALDREEQIQDHLELELADIERQIAEADARTTQAGASLRALQSSTGQVRASSVGVMPEVAAGDEHAVRVEVEIQRLQAEARGHRAVRATAAEAVASQRALLAELESHPLYRAMKTATDVGFVPYDQLAAVRAGARVVTCTWGVFHCRDVGRVVELLTGEVVTQDPWGALARGQYAVLALEDPDAIHERVLRVRP